jgi:predicted AlkP superfamily phosphohydrolase/phosphomutase
VAQVCVIGLDCVPPELAFDRWRQDLPNLDTLMTTGSYGALESTVPPITVPAWMSMLTGLDPGELGLYGFRNRRDHSYDRYAFANSRAVHEPAVWDILAESGRKSIVLGVPLTYPPRPINGWLISDFLAPDTSSEFTYPPDLRNEIRDVVGEYLFDARGFRTEDKERLLSDIHKMTQQRFHLARHLITSRPWDLFMMVEMGTDRIHHGFWRFFDTQHRGYEPGGRFEAAIHDYYVEVDREIGALTALLPEDTDVFVVSDHGAKRMEGGICFNQWLIENRYLALTAEPDGPTPLTPEMIDWGRTRAWGDGGYYGRCFLNVKGREPQGTVEPNDVEALKEELTARLVSLSDEQGRPIGTRVYRPESLYRKCRGVPPDLIVYFGDLHWRSVGSVGHPSVWTRTNDTGPDDANHAQHGIFIHSKAGARGAGAGERAGLSIYDVAPTILSAFGIPPLASMPGSVIGAGTAAEPELVYSPEEEAELARRLEDLGYL